MDQLREKALYLSLLGMNYYQLHKEDPYRDMELDDELKDAMKWANGRIHKFITGEINYNELLEVGQE